MRQQYGWVALYRRKSGENDESGAAWERRLDVATIYGATLAPPVFWHATLPKRFHWLLAGDYAAGLPAWAGSGALAAFGLVFALWLAKEARRLASSRPVSWGKVPVVVTTALFWHENGGIFAGAALDPGPILLALLVPLLALPQATHYLLDAWIWRGFKPDPLE